MSTVNCGAQYSKEDPGTMKVAHNMYVRRQWRDCCTNQMFNLRSMQMINCPLNIYTISNHYVTYTHQCQVWKGVLQYQALSHLPHFKLQAGKQCTV